ncbi:DNA polymerase IV [Corynebacterium ciconiae DSM 44920]|uniref:DNA polymerase IV n=1 Tax=Corynebacterium ciconiae TaxID=227319 RepID=UPI0003766450|nr:DNA polymerase IV [Corynebacterium ciconiae]WKD60796.1 DNA polymerase IV [Corynebacterium ciconiae DSM 44920]
MRRWVLHIDMDAFYASCEQLTRPTLRGRPVLVGGVHGRGVVAGASYEARAFGAHSAMPMFQAKAMVGFGAVVVQPRRAVYRAASARVFEIVARRAGTIEQLSIDEAFLEPHEVQGEQPEVVKHWAEQLRAEIRAETGLPASIGAGSGKQFAKIGSGEAKPDGVFVVAQEDESAMFHPLDVGKLWGIGPVSAAKLRALGVETIGDFAALTEEEVVISLGRKVGLELWNLARGHDLRPVKPRAIAKQISQEHTYPQDLLTVTAVDAAVERAATGAHRRLLHDGRGARTVTVKLRMADFHIESRSHTLNYATDDFDTLHAVAKKMVRYPDELGPIRLVGVSFSGLEAARQNVMFPELDQQIVPAVKFDDTEVGVRDLSTETAQSSDISSESEPTSPAWITTQDVEHPEYGHGWVQGSGHGVVSVRFETRTTKRGVTRSFAIDDPDLQPADPLMSLDWADWLADYKEEMD